MIKKHYTIYVKDAFGDKIFVEQFDNKEDAQKALHKYRMKDPFSYYSLEITEAVV